MPTREPSVSDVAKIARPTVRESGADPALRALAAGLGVVSFVKQAETRAYMAASELARRSMSRLGDPDAYEEGS